MDIKVLFLAAGLAVFSDNCYCTDDDKYNDFHMLVFNKPDPTIGPMDTLMLYGDYRYPDKWALALKKSKHIIDWYIDNPNEEFLGSSVIYSLLTSKRFIIQFLSDKKYQNNDFLHSILLDLFKLAPRCCTDYDRARCSAIFLCYEQCINLMRKDGILKVISDNSYDDIFKHLSVIISSHFDYDD